MAGVGHAELLPALYFAEFVPFGSSSFLPRCWQPGWEEATGALPLVLAKIRAGMEESLGSISPVGSGWAAPGQSWESPPAVLPPAALPVSPSCSLCEAVC